MDRLTKFASKLYPRWWRQRYGEEFAALLEDARPGLGGTLDVLKGALTMRLATSSVVTTLFFCAIVGALSGLATTFFLTPQYSSNTVISLALPKGSANVDMGDIMKQYSNEVMNRVIWADLIRDLNLYRDERATMPTKDVLKAMGQDVRVTAAPSVGRKIPAFEISFHSPDKVAAQIVVAALAGVYIDENIRRRRSGKENPTMEVLYPASVPTDPIFPNRRNIALAGLAAGLALGGLAAAVLRIRRKFQPV